MHRWSGQVLDTIDYCGFIGRNPGSDNVYVVTGDSGQGMTHGALAGLLLKDLIVTGTSPWEAVYDPSRKTPSGIVNFVNENVTAIKNFAEYLMPAELDSVDELKPGEGGIIRDGRARSRPPRPGRQASSVLGGLHASRLPCALEFDRAVLGLPVPRLALRAGRQRAQRPGDRAAAARDAGCGRRNAPRPRRETSRLYYLYLSTRVSVRSQVGHSKVRWS